MMSDQIRRSDDQPTSAERPQPTYTPPSLTSLDAQTLLQRIGPARAFSQNRSGRDGLLDSLLEE